MLRSTGTGYPAINADDLAEIPIWIPPLDQQEKIGAALSFLGAKIEVHQKLLSALCSVKSSLMATALYMKSCCISDAFNLFKLKSAESAKVIF